MGNPGVNGDLLADMFREIGQPRVVKRHVCDRQGHCVAEHYRHRLRAGTPSVTASSLHTFVADYYRHQ